MALARGGLLGIRSNPEHVKQMKQHGIEPIDLVVVNLYPFEQTVAKLPLHHREVFVLRELEGRSYEEIAEIMHCNLGTVKSRLNRARQSFAELIGPKLG